MSPSQCLNPFNKTHTKRLFKLNLTFVDGKFTTSQGSTIIYKDLFYSENFQSLCNLPTLEMMLMLIMFREIK